MKRTLWLLALVGALLLSAAPVSADDDIYVIIAGGGGVGTKISNLPYTIDAPGFYYVTGNLSCTSSHGIKVNANDVTIDLMGFCLSYLGDPDYMGYTGVYIQGGKNVEVRNGSLSNWRTGIYDQDTYGPPGRHRIINVRVKGRSGGAGIQLYVSCNIVKGCMVSDAGSGIEASKSTIMGNQVLNCRYGIWNGLGANLISNNLVVDCSDTGIRGFGTITGNMVNNCGIGIECAGELGSIIGNTIICNDGQTGIKIPTTDQPYFTLVDQNTVTGFGGTHFSGGTSKTVLGKNAGLP